MPMKPWMGRLGLVAVFLASLLSLGFGVHKAPIASAFSDQISDIRAQDEAFYSHAAMQMARSGDWMTPRLLGRYFLHKPPLLMWLSGLSVKGLGVSLLALRLPVLLLGSLVVALVFSWVQRINGTGAATAAAILLVSNPLWHGYSRLCQTDVLLAAWIFAALACLAQDPSLDGRAAFLGFGAFTAAAIMTKSIAGLLPLFALAVFSALVRGNQRPSARRVLQLCLLIAGLALPWHLYQWMAHSRWFWAEYVKLEILGFGLGLPARPPQEGQLAFYLKRLVLTDPFLLVFDLLAAWKLWQAWRKENSAPAVLLVSWILVAGGALIFFRSQNLPYVAILIPALCIWGAGYSSLLSGARSAPAVVLLCGLFFLKVFFGAQPWGLPFGVPHPPPSTAALRAYCERGRANELILVQPEDAYYSSVLSLPHVRYCVMDSFSSVEDYGPHLVYLGITVTAGQFADLDRWRDRFRQRMAAWGPDFTEALATVIVAGSPSEVWKVIQTHPQSDFFLPTEMRPQAEALTKATHRIAPGTPERFFLLALNSPRPGPQQGEARRLPLPRYW